MPLELDVFPTDYNVTVTEEPAPTVTVTQSPTPTVTVTAVGLQGPEGPQGEVGPTGPTGPRGPAGAALYQFTQNSAASVWHINHNLGILQPPYIVLDTAGDQVEGDPTYTDTNNMVLTFSAPFAGTATIG